MGIFRKRRTSWLDNSTNAWTHQNLNSLQYNTSQPGAVIAIIYGTMRQAMNLIALGTFTGPKGGKKGGTGTLPLTGTNTTRLGKGGGSSKSSSKKGGGNYTIDVDFAFCQGPVGNGGGTNLVFANAGVGTFSGVGGINFYDGSDGQAPDPVFDGLGDTVGYSGTCHVTGTPLDLGQAPALPNISIEISGFFAGINSNGSPDANPGDIVFDYLSNERYGAGFPAANIDDLDPTTTDSYGAYCLAADLLMSPALVTQQQAHEHIDGVSKLTNTAIVWSGDLLKMIPYGDQTITGNGVTWTPNLIPEYSLTDNDFLPWSAAEVGKIQEGQEDPILVTRSNSADAINWMTIEYKDRINYYNSTVIPDYDQGAIDLYGTRSGEAVQGHAFTTKERAKASLRLIMQRALYQRNTYKFKLGWRFALLEPMDIVLITGRSGDLYLNELAVRITGIAEDEEGALTVEAEEIVTGVSAVEISAPGLPPAQSNKTIGHSLSSNTVSSTAPLLILNPFTVNATEYPTVNLFVVAIATKSDSGTAPGVTAVSDTSGLGLSWQKRTSYRQVGPPSKSTNLEVWYAVLPSALANGTSLDVTASLDGTADAAAMIVETFGGVGTVKVWDENSSLPLTSHSGVTTPSVAPFSTSSGGSCGIAVLATPDIEFLPSADVSPWNLAVTVTSGALFMALSTTGATGEFTDPQSGLTVTPWGAVGPSGGVGHGYVMIVDAVTAS